jgi:UDP-glucose 4-epimerase
VAKSNELFYTLQRLGCGRVVFSSSASVYSTVPDYMVTEDAPLSPASPYARTKFMMEMVLKDFCATYPLKGIALRYFNPIGADPKMRSGLSLEVPSLLVGRMVEVALGKLPMFEITGTHYATRDGTGLRDYIHVWDLALAHVKAVENFDSVFQRAGGSNYLVINLGNGRGVTVREMVTAFEKVWGKPINKRDAPPRPGDVPGAYASNERAKTLLGWQPQLSIEQGISDALKWGELRQAILGFNKK